MFFSAKSFANELDGKGLDCDVKVTQTLNENTSIGDASRIVYWFNNNSLDIVNVSYVADVGLVTSPKNEFIDFNEVIKVYLLIRENTIQWEIQSIAPYKTSFTEVNRKTLDIKIKFYSLSLAMEGREKVVETRKGKCKVYSGFNYVKQYQEEMKANILKSLEENKI